MNLKTRIALNLSIAFSIIMGIVMTVIYISFANFRKAEFKENLEHSAVVTANYISKLPQKVLNNDDKTVDDINNNEDDFLIKEKFWSLIMRKILFFLMC
jgi:sensor histidine kinase regulating citrate/malate metabolism